MSQMIPAIFDGSVFKPLVPVQLEQGTRVEVGVPDAATPPSAPPTPNLSRPFLETLPDDSSAEFDVASWQQFIADMEAISDNSVHDGFSNRDHDRVLYGE